MDASEPLHCVMWHTEGTAVSGILSWMYRLKKTLPSKGIKLELASLEIKPFRFTQTGEADQFYDIRIRTPQEFMVFLKRNQNAAHVINHSFEYIEIALELCAPFLARMKLVGVCHTDQDYYYANLAKADAYLAGIFAVSSLCVEKLEKLLPHRRGKIPVLPDWDLVLPQIRELKVEKNLPLRLLFNGRILHLQKRVFDLAMLCEKLKALGVPAELSIVGDGPDLDELKQKLGAAATIPVHFYGAKPPWEMDAILAKHDVFIQTSEFEGASVSLMEAMAFQLVPVVTATDSGVHLLKDRENSLLANVGDMCAMADHIRYLHQNRSEIRRLANAGRQTAENYLRELNYPAQLASFLRGIVQN